jgi:fluoroquinolone transport system permease protein
MTSYNHLIRSDWKLIGRDPMLVMSFVAPILITIVAVFGVPQFSVLSTQWFNFPLDEYLPFINLFFLPLTAMLFGMIYGFILLDERDEGLIAYLSITPIGKSGYLSVRMLMPVVYSFVFSMFFLYVTGLYEQMNLAQNLVLSLIMASEAPMILLFLAAFAGNKVEGIALSKGFGILLISMVPGYFLETNWIWALAVSPLWWVERAVFATGSSWLYLTGAAVVHALFLLLLFRKFEKRLG